MTKPYINFKDGYKYQLEDDYIIQVRVVPGQDVKQDYLELSTKGNLFIRKGYAWDGPSGPTIDTENFMRGSLVHDALYQLIRNELIGQHWREQADAELKNICIQDGMSRIRAWWVHAGVRLGGGPAASVDARKTVHQAP